jgi:hypothetical protein
MTLTTDGEAIEIQFELRPRDLARTRVWMVWRRWPFKVFYVFFALCSVFMVVAALTIGIDRQTRPSLFFAMGFLILLPGLLYLLGLQTARGLSPAQRTTRYSVTSDSIHVESGVGESRLSWQAVQAADESPSYFYMWPSKGIVYPIPKRGFRDPTGVDRFRELLRQKLGKKARVHRS